MDSNKSEGSIVKASPMRRLEDGVYRGGQRTRATINKTNKGEHPTTVSSEKQGTVDTSHERGANSFVFV